MRDYRVQGETAGASALARVYSQLSTTVDMTGCDIGVCVCVCVTLGCSRVFGVLFS